MRIDSLVDEKNGRFIFRIEADWGFLASVPENKANRKKLLVTMIMAVKMRETFPTTIELIVVGIHGKKSVLTDDNALEFLKEIYETKSRREAENILIHFW